MISGALFLSSCEDNKNEPQKTLYSASFITLFDTVTVIKGYEETKEEFSAVVQEVFDVLEGYHKMFDIYYEYSGINNLCTVNKKAGEPVEVSSEMLDMLEFCIDMHEKTSGKVNVAMGRVLSIWHDYRSEADDNYGVGELPPMEDLQEAAKHTNIDNLIIDEENSTVYLADPLMKLDVGAIAKGYAVEMVAQMLESRGITGYVINVGGNIRTVGTKANGDKWLAGIEAPSEDFDEAYLAYLGLAGETIVTSGSYQRYYIVDGEAYHHIIDRETLMPARGFLSVSIICKNSADGDGLSTALFCMPLEDGMALIESLDGVEAHWVLEDGTRVKSSGFSDFEVESNQ